MTDETLWRTAFLQLHIGGAPPAQAASEADELLRVARARSPVGRTSASSANGLRLRISAIDVTDYEVAHQAEDMIWRDVLMAIAAGAEDPRELARVALTTGDLRFNRCHA